MIRHRLKTRLIRLAGAAALGLACSNVAADDFNYWGLEVLLVQQDADIVLPGDAALTADTDTSSYGSRLLFGRQFSRFFAVEAGAFTYRTAPTRLLDADQSEILRIRAQSDVAIDFRAVATLPVGDALFFKLHAGPRFWNRRTFTIAPTNNDESEFTEVQSTETSATAGLALGIAWGRNAAVVLGYEHMSAQPHEGSYASIGMTFRLD